MSNSDMTNRQVCCDVKPGCRYDSSQVSSSHFVIRLCYATVIKTEDKIIAVKSSSIIKLKQLNLFFSLVGELSEFITLGTQEQEHKKLLLVAPGSLYLRADGRRTNSSTSGRSDPAKINQLFTEYVHR